MVLTKSEKQEPNPSLVWMENVPFSCCPKKLIEQIEDHPFTYEEFITQAEFMNKQEVVWNMALIYQEKNVLAFTWGIVDPLDRMLRISHLTADPCLFRFGKAFLLTVYYELSEIKKRKGLRRVYWESSRWEAFKRKGGLYAEVLSSRILEVK